MVKKTVVAAVLAAVSGIADAAPAAWSGAFNLYDSTGVNLGGATDVTGYIDQAAGTFTLASSTPFMGYNWTASGGTLYGPGTYTISTVDPAPGVSGGSYNFTVGDGQLAGSVKFAWNITTGIDVLMVWNVATNGGNTTYTSTDVDGNGIPGIAIVDGPFVGFSPAFSMVQPVPVPTATWLLGSGLMGLMGVARRRRSATKS